MNITQNMFTILTAKNLKQKELADYIGVPTSTLSNWKSTNKNPPSEKLIPICEFLGISVYHLLGMSDIPEETMINQGIILNAEQNNNNVINNNQPAHSDELTEELIKKFKNLSFDDKIKVFNYINGLEE